jgi:MraZ protein
LAIHSNKIRGIVPSFKGEYEHALDAKGRVSFPAKLRKYLNPDAQERFTIVKGLETCLYLYPEDRWKDVEDRLSEINSFSTEGRTVIRNFLRSADDLELDNANRLALPAKLTEWAGITGKVIFIGSGDKIELWSPEHLDQQDQTMDVATWQDLFEKVMGNKHT